MIKYNVDRPTIIWMKLAVVVFTIIVLKVWNEFATWVQDVNVWWFVLVFVILAIRVGVGYPCRDSSGNMNSPKPIKKKVIRKKTRKK
jgi:hypothetical protein